MLATRGLLRGTTTLYGPLVFLFGFFWLSLRQSIFPMLLPNRYPKRALDYVSSSRAAAVGISPIDKCKSAGQHHTLWQWQ